MSSDLGLVNGAPATGRRFQPAGPTAPVLARRAVRRFLADAGADRRCQEVAELLASELVTNVMEHARSTARVSVSVTDGLARVEVSDDGPGEPRLRERDDNHGYGLWLVECLAQTWGVRYREGQEKTVWLVIPLSAGSLTYPELFPDHENGPFSRLQPVTAGYSRVDGPFSRLDGRAHGTLTAP